MGLKITYAPWGETLAELVDAAQRAEALLQTMKSLMEEELMLI